METYYKDQLNKVQPHKTEYAPTIKVFANGNGEDTKNLSLNKESALALVEWLTKNFIEPKPVKVTNWADFKDQFGTDFTSDRYKSSLELLKELTNKAFDKDGIVKQIAIDYERNNIDSGICLFEFKEILNGVVMYDFTGTAK